MDALGELYKKETYLDKYGGSVIMTVIILLIFFVLWSYYYVKGHMKAIRGDWAGRRCSPSVLPFAGLINAPPDESKLEYTEKNFGHCTQSILTTISADLTKSVDYASSLVHDVYTDIETAIQDLRDLFSRIRTDATSFADKMYNRILNVLTAVQFLVIKIRTIINKTTGVMTTSLLTTFGAYLGLQSMLGAFVRIVIIVLIIISSFVILMWLVLMFPLAITATAVFVAVAIPLGIIIENLDHIIDLTGQHIPGKPACFDKDTTLRTKKGSVKIQFVQPGDELEDGSIVTGTFALAADSLHMYNHKGVIVSGTHRLKTSKGGIRICDHEDSRRLPNYEEPIVYCLNTTSKRIRIGGLEFLDWDELTANELSCIKKTLSDPSIEKNNINGRLDGGFLGSTQLDLDGQQRVPISSVRVGDVLSTGEKVLGTVTIIPNSIKSLGFGTKTIYGGPNLQISDHDLGDFSTLAWPDYTSSEKNLYHLITDTDFVHVEGVRFCDFNGSLDQILEHGRLSKPSTKILSFPYV